MFQQEVAIDSRLRLARSQACYNALALSDDLICAVRGHQPMDKCISMSRSEGGVVAALG